MDLETACRDLREPGVIDEKILYTAIIEQGPKGEEGRLFKQQGVVYEEITNLRLEFLNCTVKLHGTYKTVGYLVWRHLNLLVWAVKGAVEFVNRDRGQEPVAVHVFENISWNNLSDHITEPIWDCLIQALMENILKIDHLWMMTGLTKLQLSNNAIEKIENLDSLINLKELDLSFNFIEKIENLNALLGLEVLTLYQNKIEILENLNHLSNLTVFSIGNNRITNYDGIRYLRRFETLRSFNMAGNPICSDENFNKFVFAYLPQLVYYEYRLISRAEKEEAREIFLKDLVKLERDEAEIKELEIAKRKEEKEECLNAEAFVEYLGGSQLFLSLFEKDTDCKTLLQMGDNVMDVYDEYKRNFTEVTKELHTFGLQQLELRKAEMAQFEKHIGAAKDKAFWESREIVEVFLEQKNLLFAQVKELLNTEAEDEDSANEVVFNVQIINDAFKDLCYRTWMVLMKKELHLFESTEEVNGTYERALTELVNQFIEGAQAQFTQLRQLQNTFNEVLTDTTNKFFTNYTVATATKSADEYKNLPVDLVNMLQDKEALTNALSASHDYHLLIIDQREDKLVSGIRTWLSNLVGNLVESEINRNRTSITEINNFLDTQKTELHELLSTPVGLLLLPKEIQDALQM